jgi:hypothetical protein
MRSPAKTTGNRGSVFRSRTWRVALLAPPLAVTAMLVTGAAARTARTASPVFQVSFRFTQVGVPTSGGHVGDLIHSLTAGSGTLSFDVSPKENGDARADTATGTVVYRNEFATLPDRQVRLTVVGGTYDNFTGSLQAVHLQVEVAASNFGFPRECRPGDQGGISAIEGKAGSAVLVGVPGCALHNSGSDVYRAKRGRNSRVQVGIFPKCLRTTAAVGKPLCGSPEPTEFTLTVNGTSSTLGLHEPDHAYPQITNVDRASFSPQISATLDEPLPKGWEFDIYRPADPLSPGNGVYYYVCHTATGSKTCNLCPSTPAWTPPEQWRQFYTVPCGAVITRPPANPSGAGGEFVIAGVVTPTYWRATGVDIVYKKQG